MTDPAAADILILAAEKATAQRWVTMLEGFSGRVRVADEVPAELVQVDVILTDRKPPAGPEGLGRDEVPSGSADHGSPGVIQIGTEGPADVWLPADVTGRELRLACRLMAEIVRLRRQQLAREQLHRRLTHEALTDPLTGLPNRRAWDGILRERLGRLVGYQAPTEGWSGAVGGLCLAIFDLDHFKWVNDASGHAVGDQVLRAAAGAISGSLRHEDFVARLGGDEFGLLLSVPDRAAAMAVVERVRSGLPERLRTSSLPVVTTSAGFCLLPARNRDVVPPPDALFTAADAALGQAKRRGRNCTVEGTSV